ncbi:MAG TPA: hypothetical protein VFX41_10925 [Actinomycetales bacterium]|nr:hypothetical protein [Actinomycetales bacterium]
MTEAMTDHTSDGTGEPSDTVQSPEPQTHRCRACGARLTADAPWCTLCFTPVSTAATDAPQGSPEPDADTQAGAPAAVGEPLAVAGDEALAASVEATQDDSPQDDDSPQHEQTHQLADELMARLASERPAPSRLAGLAPSSGLARAGVSVVGVVLVTGLAFGLMALLGSFL